MLKDLHIENIAVIEKTDISFSDGFHVLTGETGAGKSIVIDAINTVLGERTSKELVRSGCDRAEVCAVFTELSGESLSRLAENGFEPDENGELLIRRTLSATGGGSVRIGGKPATVGILRDIGKTLVNIHGQHDNQSLLNADNHCRYIDRMAENDGLIDEYYAEFKNFNSVRRELSRLETDEDEKRRRTELLKYQINELESAAIKPGEVERLKQQLELAENSEKTKEALLKAYGCLNGSDDCDGAFSMTANAAKLVSGLGDKRFSEMASRLEMITEELKEIARNFRHFDENDEFSAFDVNIIGQRLDNLHRLMLKYGNTEEKMLEFLSNAKSELSGIENSDEMYDKLSQELDASTERLVSLGNRLTGSRLETAKSFSERVTSVLGFLDMADASLEVSLQKGRYTKNGCDVVEFMIRTNRGEDLKPLCKIASGGELSRIMLAIKSVLADKDDVDTLIFDEIDTGISGRAAGKVGIQLKRVAKNRQVICVTHLAQIAAFAGKHMLIQKQVDGGRTFTEVKALDYEQRISEVARIMSGTEMTENLYHSAKELLDRSMGYADL